MAKTKPFKVVSITQKNHLVTTKWFWLRKETSYWLLGAFNLGKTNGGQQVAFDSKHTHTPHAHTIKGKERKGKKTKPSCIQSPNFILFLRSTYFAKKPLQLGFIFSPSIWS